MGQLTAELAAAEPAGPSALRVKAPKPVEGALASGADAAAAAADAAGARAAAALTLAIHCLLAREGFVVLDDSGQPARGGRPPPGWSRRFENEHVLLYTRPRSRHAFVLHCSLHPVRRQLFVHASEVEVNGAHVGERVGENMQVLGLTVPNQVDAAALAAAAGRGEGAWRGVLADEARLEEMVLQHVVRPLWAAAEKEAAVGALLGSPAAAAAAVCVAAVVLGVAVVWMRRRSAAAAVL